MFQDFLTAFSPVFQYIVSAFDAIIGIFLSTDVNSAGQPLGIVLFGVPLLMYPIVFWFLYLVFKTIFSK